tara:strand:+ start:435 stop:1094 length:660 start_codon:yes stop_codon:yes gene_type:complete
MTEAEPSLREETRPQANDPAEENMPSPDSTVEDTLSEEGTSSSDIDIESTVTELGLTLPNDPAESTKVLLKELLQSRSEANEYLAMMQRVAADFENYRKRIERDHTETVQRSSQRVVEHLLPALDSFDAAITYEAQSPAEEKILDGMRGTHAQLMDILKTEGLTPVATVGELFDPAVHEAASGPSGDSDAPLFVSQELRRGYTMGGRVIRPSLVVVEHS